MLRASFVFFLRVFLLIGTLCILSEISKFGFTGLPKLQKKTEPTSTSSPPNTYTRKKTLPALNINRHPKNTNHRYTNVRFTSDYYKSRKTKPKETTKTTETIIHKKIYIPPPLFKKSGKNTTRNSKNHIHAARNSKKTTIHAARNSKKNIHAARNSKKTIHAARNSKKLYTLLEIAKKRYTLLEIAKKIYTP